MSEEIGDSITNEKEYQKHTEESLTCEMKIRVEITKLERFIADKENKTSSLSSSRTVSDHYSDSPKKSVALPKLQIKKFSGDCTEWQSFIETFDEAIHKNKTLSNIEKFTYLTSFVTDDAHSCIKGLKLSNDNYQNARDLLFKRFDDR